MDSAGCPACGAEVEIPPTDPLGPWPELARTQCPTCEVEIVRAVDADPAEPWVEDVADPSPRQSRARLEAVAARHGLEFRTEDTGPIWRFSLAEPRPVDHRGDVRVLRATGAGHDERDALIALLSDAVVKGLL